MAAFTKIFATTLLTDSCSDGRFRAQGARLTRAPKNIPKPCPVGGNRVSTENRKAPILASSQLSFYVDDSHLDDVCCIHCPIWLPFTSIWLLRIFLRYLRFEDSSLGFPSAGRVSGQCEQAAFGDVKADLPSEHSDQIVRTDK